MRRSVDRVPSAGHAQCGVNIMQYDLSVIRIMGILQRVAVCYLVGALMEICLPRFQPYIDISSAWWTMVALCQR